MGEFIEVDLEAQWRDVRNNKMNPLKVCKVTGITHKMQTSVLNQY